MRYGLALLLALCLLPTVVSAQQQPAADREALLTQAITAMSQRRLNDSLQLSETIISAFDAEYGKSDKLIFCAENSKQMIILLARAAALKKDGETLNMTWCTALFLKGFVLIDLNRAADAKPFLARAAEMAPLDAHFLNEYAEWHKSARQWQDAYDWFEKARDASEYSADEFRKGHQARSLRGMGFVTIELGDLEKASKFFKDSLELVPNHPAALSELKYIEDLRRAQK